MLAISPTDRNWFNFLKNNNLNFYVNFWSPTPWNIKRLSLGDKFYFMLKSPVRKIGGFGEFVEYKNMVANNAGIEFGYRNGRRSKSDFINSIQKYLDSNSKEFGTKKISIDTHQIGCIVLKNCQFFDEESYIDLNRETHSFSNQIVKIKYFDSTDIILTDLKTEDFNIISEVRDKKLEISNSRMDKKLSKQKF